MKPDPANADAPAFWTTAVRLGRILIQPLSWRRRFSPSPPAEEERAGESRRVLLNAPHAGPLPTRSSRGEGESFWWSYRSATAFPGATDGAALGHFSKVRRASKSARGLAQSKSWRNFVATFYCFVGLSYLLSPLHAQPSATNRVLELDGTGGYVELPPNVFNDLEEATVEAWVRWDDFSGESKRVFNYGDARRDFSITSRDAAPSLWFVIGDAQQQLHEIDLPNLLRTQ